MFKNIIFDFDGVILDSVPVKTEAFKKLFNDYPFDKVKELILYHEKNGGKSRYVKIKYFFESILEEKIDEKKILLLANEYSLLTREELSKEKYLILDSVQFIKKNYNNLNMHIASGADENDLKYICDKLGLTQYFFSINGSPLVKDKIVANIITDNNYCTNDTILIGDSINDYDAAKLNRIRFFGYNNKYLKKVSDIYIKDFRSLI